MKQIYLYLIITQIIFFLSSCETNPPTDPNKVELKTGQVVVSSNFTQNQNLSVQKIVLLEDFANVSCTPCLISNKIIESVSRHSENSNRIRVIKFPTNFPSPVDPMYLTAKDYCDFRMRFYNILFAPTIIVDGIMKPVPTDSNQIKIAIQQRLQLTSDFQISDSSEIINEGMFIHLNILTNNINNPDLENLVLRIALVETEVVYSTPPGSNGETIFYDVVRMILPSNEGIKLSEIKGQKTFSFENSLNTNWNLDKLRAVSFIQNLQTKEIIQSCIHQ